jgi:SAM-dependent methyltransferase
MTSIPAGRDGGPPQPRADYGYDAPYALIGFAAAAVIAGVGAAIVWRTTGRLLTPPLIVAVFFCAQAASFFYTTRRGKFVEWARILDSLALRGDERVLDIGCGRGAVTIAVARRLRTGSVTGVDLWLARDQSGNARDVPLRNAAIEGVADRVAVETADMRALPFADASFDLVVSSLAIHNLPSNPDRARAVGEAWRVLAPGGRLVIADIKATRVYASRLAALGARAVTRRRLGWRFWWGNPLAGTTLVTALKEPDPALLSPSRRASAASPEPPDFPPPS